MKGAIKTIMDREVSVENGKHAIWLTIHDTTPTTLSLTPDEAIALGEKLIQAGFDKESTDINIIFP